MLKEHLLPLLIFTGFVGASYFDSLILYPKQFKAAKESQYQCDNLPDNCWIRNKTEASKYVTEIK